MTVLQSVIIDSTAHLLTVSLPGVRACVCVSLTSVQDLSYVCTLIRISGVSLFEGHQIRAIRTVQIDNMATLIVHCASTYKCCLVTGSHAL